MIQPDCTVTSLSSDEEVESHDVWLIDTGRTCIEEGTATITLSNVNPGVLQISEGEKVSIADAVAGG